MPTLIPLNHPPDTTPEPSCSGHSHLGASGTHIYLALGAIAILLAIRLATSRSSSTPSWAPNPPFQEAKGRSGLEARKDSAASYGKHHSAAHPPWARHQGGVSLSVGRESPNLLPTAGLPPRSVGTGAIWPAAQVQAMDGIDDARTKDRSGSASVASRGVSTSNPSGAAYPGHRHTTPPHPGSYSGFSPESRRGNGPPLSPPQSSSLEYYSSSSDGAVGSSSRKGPFMAGYAGWDRTVHPPEYGGDHASRPLGLVRTAETEPMDHQFPGHLSGPPMAAPTLSPTTFPFENRRNSYAISIPPELDTSFIHQPNPDYMAETSSSDIYSPSPKSATVTPRRRSYTKTVSVAMPIPPNTASASSSGDITTSGGAFSPSSYPPTSPMLPPPPPVSGTPFEYQFVGGPGGPGIPLSTQEIEVHGEIVSALNDEGHGWKRHTRVYGGGVCLACVAAEGGFYGDKVPLEDRR